MQQIKGSVVKSRLAFVEENFGKEGVNRVLATLPEPDRKTLASILTVKWYPLDLGTRLDEAIVNALADGKPDFFERLGAASAEKNLTGVHRSFLSVGDPHAFLTRTPAIYSMYYEKGRREYKKTGDRSATLTTYDAETFSAPDCLTIVGWHRRALEMCGAKNARVVEVECRATGGSVCRYQLSWD